MIPALLGGGEVGYAAAAVPLRAAHYAGTLGGAGLAFFALLFGRGLAAAEWARLRRWACGAAALGVLAGVGVLAAQAGALAGGDTQAHGAARHRCLLRLRDWREGDDLGDGWCRRARRRSQ